MEKWTNLWMSLEFYLKCKETETKIADIETVQVVIIDGVRREVPAISSVLSELQFENCFEFCGFYMFKKFCIGHSKVRVVIWMHVRGMVFCVGVLYFQVGPTNAWEGDPVIVTLVEVLKVDVVAIGILISWFGGVIIYN